MTEFAKRILGSVILLVLLIFVLFSEPIFINIAVFILTCIGLFEINKAMRSLEINSNIYFYIFVAIFNALELYFNNSIQITIYVVLAISLYNLLFYRRNIINVSAMSFSMLYVILGFSAIALIGNQIFIGLIFVISFSTDTFAYLTGMTLGKRKLIPDVSPKKSVEGAIGGILGCIICVYLYLNYFQFSNVVYDIIIAIIGAVVAQCGDLVASRIKRDTGIKDFGRIIPGHGGIIDRFDSVLLVAQAVYFLYNILYI